MRYDYIIENYDKNKCFSSFLPGIAGKNGIPMWVFYVNRGQCIASFGIENKNNAIMEFKPADQSYTATPLRGFRTFIKIDGEYYEPFSELNDAKREMRIKKNSLEIVEESKDLTIKVIYFTIPNDNYAALVRRVEIDNKNKKNLEIVDGMPEVLPYGISNALFKEMGFTARAWMQVNNYENKVPFYSVRTAVGDLEVVEEVTNGYFYFASYNDKLLDVIYDKNILFGNKTGLVEPYEFKYNSLENILHKKQYDENNLPSAFCGLKDNSEKIVINSMIGFSHTRDYINENIDKIKTNEYIINKMKEADDVVNEIVSDIYTNTSNESFNKYCEQNYLDNILRGGYPILFNDNKIVYHIYSRKHGDLERDYNFFSLEANKYSQGNGNFRDVLQNRRNDIIFKPEIDDFNLKMFINLIQADGNNPLVVKGTVFKYNGNYDNLDEKLADYLKNNYFTPGKLLTFVENNGINVEDDFIENILKDSIQLEQAEFGEGYWIDHWTYIMDLVETYYEIYPDKIIDKLFNERKFKIFDSHAFVKPRSEKYKIYKGRVMQIAAIGESEKKAEIIKKRGHNYLVDKDNNIYNATMFEKLLLLAVNKFATLDPYGMGLEMEANKPGWNDALNGLPGIFGSGMSETFELKRLLLFLKEYCVKDVEIFEELKEFIDNINYELDNFKDQFTYWNNIYSHKEDYRKKVFFKIGERVNISKEYLLDFINKMINKLDDGIKKAKEIGKGVYPSFFTYDLVEYEEKDGGIIPKRFEVNVLPYFLEGIVRSFKVIDDNERKELYKFVKESNIYDKKLKMYKTSESIMDQPYSIGRLRAFTPGWLENESIFMHMEFKYLLEILKANMLEEFYEDIKTMLPPYMKYEVYGRSLLENSSFIVSSANKNENLHGQGFSARLSGSTAEFLSMWKLMFIGNKLFKMENNELTFTFEPRLNYEFYNNGEIEFKLFSKTLIKYINKNNSKEIKRMEIFIENKKLEVTGNKLKGELAHKLRNKEIDKIICYFE
ncbi:hypothetical protein [Marinitoga sp. 38H-ov]|uniref:hypothetical protein n=1 Tax=Marinitoga sp. 38H-ov TaxID=1755814 RepID=UPI0013EBB29F|nr:hypothetical protein [Marinitoga sp. 38H-ov]KAF2955848.1 hypothetical protein AS160_08695 [Marinitoga sp. 38H-ov]